MLKTREIRIDVPFAQRNRIDEQENKKLEYKTKMEWSRITRKSSMCGNST